MNETGDTRIQIDPAICGGRPVISGTRVPVAIVVGGLAGGMSMEEVAREYDLRPEDIRAALKFASERLGDESFHPLPSQAA
ncbi:MAG: DUF433 domain-containing protein [Xanthomonadales bacterium]|nr:DUF433 domain-containing protein [Xanthomonadales bacterium]